MIYQRSYEIELRLESVLRLIRTGKFSTPMLAEQVGVSIPTVSRCVNALRERGYEIRSERHSEGWRYILPRKPRVSRPSGERGLAEIAR